MYFKCSPYVGRRSYLELKPLLLKQYSVSFRLLTISGCRLSVQAAFASCEKGTFDLLSGSDHRSPFTSTFQPLFVDLSWWTGSCRSPSLHGDKNSVVSLKGECWHWAQTPANAAAFDHADKFFRILSRFSFGRFGLPGRRTTFQSGTEDSLCGTIL